MHIPTDIKSIAITTYTDHKESKIYYPGYMYVDNTLLSVVELV